MSKDKIRIVCPHVIVVEGKDEERFFGELHRRMGISNVQVLPIGGKTKLRENLRALKLVPGVENLKTLCVIRDADDDPRSAFQSVRDALKSAGFDPPTRPQEFQGSDPRVIIMILPSSEACGALEDLCLESVANDEAFACVEAFFSCLESRGICKPSRSDLKKLKVQAFLASKPKPGLELGTGAEAGCWPLDSNVFEPLRRLIKDIVGET